MGRIIGGDRHLSRLRAMTGPRLPLEVTRALFGGGNVIEVEAELSITRGAVSGAGHVASKPGEPPNADTHALDRQIETSVVAPLRVNTVSAAPHAVPLEVGTSRMEARPSMGPAARKKRLRVVQLVAAAVNRVNRGRGGR
jgi:hypothetical protein